MEFSASVGFIHKVSVTMHGHTILKLANLADFETHCRKFGLSSCLKENDLNCFNNVDLGMMWTRYVNINSGRSLRKEELKI